MIRVLLGLILLLMAFTPAMPPLADTAPHDSVADNTNDAVRTTVLEAYGKLPISFVHNQGQLDERVEYYAKASGQTLYFTDEGIAFDLVRRGDTEEAERLVFSLDFLGTNNSPVIQGRDRDTAVVNYFIGNDPNKWHTDIPTYREITYSSIYPNIDLRLYGNGGVLEYDFVVNPGSSVSDIALAYRGIDNLSMKGGELVASTAFGDMTQTQPYIYQQIGDDVVEVDGGFKLISSDTYGFEVAAYDARYPLVIDPSLVYSTFLGGSADEEAWGIAVDSSGCAYVTGFTTSLNFPMQNSYNGTYGGNTDTFVTKFSAVGNSLIYSTYLGASQFDVAWGIAVDSSGCAYVTGMTASADFPSTPGSYNGTFGGGTVFISDAFVTKFNAAGNSLVYSTYLGGAGDDQGWSIAVDSAGCAYVTGYTESGDFPSTPGSYNGTYSGNQDAFVTKIDTTQTGAASLIYSTYLGGSGGDIGCGIAADSSGAAYVTGATPSTDFPMQNSYNATFGGGIIDAFVSKIDTTKTGIPSLIYSTYLGGVGLDQGHGIAVDSSGSAYVTGYTMSGNFPMQNPYDSTFGGTIDTFVTKFTAAGNSLIYSTYLSGGTGGVGYGIAVDSSGCAYVTGMTSSPDFPTQDPCQANYGGGGADAFVTKFAAAGTSLVYSTFLGGSGIEPVALGGPWPAWPGSGVAVDASGHAYIAGYTDSGDFPTQNPYQAARSGATDAFVAKLGAPDIGVSPTSIDFGSVAVGSSSTPQTVTITNHGTANLVIGTITLAGANANEFSIQNDNCSGQTLAPGASATVELAFNPTSAGAKTATLSIPSNDLDEAIVNVTLNGSGAQAPPSGRSSPTMQTPAQLPPAMALQYLAVNPQQQYASQPVTITTNVSNTGGSTGQYTVTLMINGQVEETRLVSVGAQSALPVKFIVTRDVPGTYTVTIGSQQSSFTILGADSAARSPATSSLIAIVLVGILVLLTAVVLLLSFRRRAW